MKFNIIIVLMINVKSKQQQMRVVNTISLVFILLFLHMYIGGVQAASSYASP